MKSKRRNDRSDISARKMIEQSLLDYNMLLRDFISRMETVREDERKRIAREIHDELGQILTAIHFEIFSIERRLRDDDPLLSAMIQRVKDLATGGIKTVQKISSRLRPALLDEIGLVSAIELHANEFSARTGIKASLSLELSDHKPGPDREMAIYRIHQEAMTNVARHANATEVKVTLIRNEDSINYEVLDNGRGISEKDLSSRKSYGLMGIRERALMCGGETVIMKNDGGGTLVRVSIPC
jgi:signal transduction histidine kinase